MVLMAHDSGVLRVESENPKDEIYKILKRGGDYTVAEVSVESGLTVSETEKYLWAIASEGKARRTAHGYVAMETVGVGDSATEENGNGNSVLHAA